MATVESLDVAPVFSHRTWTRTRIKRVSVWPVCACTCSRRTWSSRAGRCLLCRSSLAIERDGAPGVHGRENARLRGISPWALSNNRRSRHADSRDNWTGVILIRTWRWIFQQLRFWRDISDRGGWSRHVAGLIASTVRMNTSMNRVSRNAGSRFAFVHVRRSNAEFWRAVWEIIDD